MEDNEFEATVKLITKLILTQPRKMIREEDLQNLSKNFNFEKIMSKIYLNLKNIGFEFIKSKLQNDTYYILTSEGKDDTISPSQYGTLALLIAMSKEVDDNLKIKDLKEIFSEVWESDIEFLLKNDYLIKIEDLGAIVVSPLGKALMKNIIQDLDLKNLLDIFTN
ncbi:MAG: hypothetical protein ACFE8M_02970 [Candidatus Hermodarchaeota archaeon]